MSTGIAAALSSENKQMQAATLGGEGMQTMVRAGLLVCVCVCTCDPTRCSCESNSTSRPQHHLGADARQRAQRLSGLAVWHVTQAMQPGCAAARLRVQLRSRFYHKPCAVAKPSGTQVLLGRLFELFQRRERIIQHSLRPLGAPCHQDGAGNARDLKGVLLTQEQAHEPRLRTTSGSAGGSGVP